MSGPDYGILRFMTIGKALSDIARYKLVPSTCGQWMRSANAGSGSMAVTVFELAPPWPAEP